MNNIIPPTSKEERIIKEINELIPNVNINSLQALKGNVVNETFFFLSKENRYLSNSQYFYNDKLNFIHFSNLFALQSIISQRNIRLYNLHNLNDPREYSFAGDLITFNREDKQNAKDNFYLLSMCNTDLLLNTKNTENEFNMWRLYGANGQGVALELSFDGSNANDWRDYFLSSVYYGNSSRTKIRELSRLLKQLDSEQPQVRVDVGQLACFHKSKLFKLEQEVRLLFDARKMEDVHRHYTYTNKEGEIVSPNIRTDIFKSSVVNKEIKYLELPIYHNKFTPYSINCIPVPKIEKIILGYHYRDINKIADHLKALCYQQLGYIPKIEKSRLTKYYHDVPNK